MTRYPTPLLRRAVTDLIGRQRHGEAWAVCRAGLEQQPNSVELLVDAGSLLLRLERYAEAEAYLARAAALRPESPTAWDNLACCLRDLNRIPDSLRCLDQALSLDPRSARAHYDRALALLTAGQFEQGFAEYEHRWAAAQIKRPGDGDPVVLERLWRGGDIAGKRIFVYAEQGLGDAIQFLRYARLVRERGATVVLEVQPALRGLAGCLQPACETGPREVDAHCPLMTLPLVFGTTVDTIPRPAVFALPEDLRRRWRARIPLDDRLNVGLAWAGNSRNPIDYRRSMHLATFEPLFGESRLRFFSFQVGPRSSEAAGKTRSPVIDLAPELRMLTDTAAALLRMDLVITVDSAVAHLAASLGLKTWILLPLPADWRWLLRREDSPWYPSARLFRQTVPGDWADVIRRVRRELPRTLADWNGLVRVTP